jgi:predicted nucleic acid-binding protein
MKILIDTNIILDVLLNRAPWVTDSQAIWDACDKGKATGYVTATTLTNIFYIAKRATNLAQAQQAVRLCLDTFTVCPVDQDVLERAYQIFSKDFEDDVQIACAVLSGLDAIITRNTADFSHATIPVFTPAVWAARYL